MRETPAWLRVMVRHSPIPQLPQVGGNGTIQLRGLDLLLPPRRDQSTHLLLERFVIVLLRLRADITARREHVSVLPYLLESCASAEAGNVGVFADLLLAAPYVIGVSDARDVLVGQLAMRAVDEAAKLAGVDEQHVTAPVAEPPIRAIAREEPEAGR